MRIKALLLAFCLVLCASVGYAVSPSLAGFSFTAAEDGQMYFTYSLNDPDNNYFDTLRDAVRGHHRVQVKHEVTISPMGDLWGNLAKATKTYYVSYDVLRESFEIGDTPESVTLTTHDEGTASYLLLGVRDLPLVAVNQLYTGQNYKINVKISIDATHRSRWTRWLPLKWFGKEEINVEALYTAR